MSDDEDELVVESPDFFVNNRRHKIKYEHYIPDAEKITSSQISKYEYARILHIRISQVQNGGRLFTDIYDKSGKVITDVKMLVVKEFLERKTPLILLRKIRVKDNIEYIERWRVCEMQHCDVNYF